MTALVSKTDISGTPSRATANSGFAALWDFINERLGAGGASDVERAASLAALGIAVPRGWIDGLKLSTAGSSTTMTVGAGQAADSTGVRVMRLASSLNKTTSAWAVGSGNGGLDTGTIANNTWYHFHQIFRADTGVVDVLASLSASAPTLPAGYTHFRRIGAGRTNGSGQWIRFFQDGDLFQWETPVLDVNVTNPGTSAVSRTLTVPSGVRVRARFNFLASDLGNANQVNAYFSDLQTADLAASVTAAPLAMTAGTANNTDAGMGTAEVMTNTSAQVRSRLNSAPGVAATLTLRMATLGWYDSRGRDA
jgi:hypothetical protein